MLSRLIQLAVSCTLYSVALTGLVLLLGEELKRTAAWWRSRKRLSVKNRTRLPRGKLELHLYHLLALVLRNPVQPRSFILASIWIGITTLVVSLRTLPLLTTLSLALLTGLLPYAALRLKAELKKRKGSHEGEQLVAELLRQYRICRFNIYEAVEAVVTDKQAAGPVSRRLLYQMLAMLRDTGSEAGIRLAVSVFAEGIGTNWSRMMGRNIRLAAERGTDVSLALEDILIQLRQAREIFEERNRLNSEAARMTLFLVPLLYVGTIFLAGRYMELSPATIYANQLQTPEGLSVFFAIWILFALNVAVLELINHQKFDF